MPKFGVARKYAKDFSDYIVMLNQNNVDAYEMGFAYGIQSDFLDEIIELSKRYNVSLSSHLPFWINLGNSDEERNINYLVSGLKVAEKLNSVAVFHLGFYKNIKFDELKIKIVNLIKKAIESSGIKSGRLGIETTGKQKAIGTVNEVIEILELINDERVIPIIDWAHIYARSNGTYPYYPQDFKEILVNLERKIGYKPSYFHGGGIKYKGGNEVKHISAKTFEPPLPHLFVALKDLSYHDFTFIVESPDSIEDVRWLRQVWNSPKDYLKEVPNKRATTLSDFRVRK